MALVAHELDLGVGHVREVRADDGELGLDERIGAREARVDREHDLRALRQRRDLRRDLDLETAERVLLARDHLAEARDPRRDRRRRGDRDGREAGVVAVLGRVGHEDRCVGRGDRRLGAERERPLVDRAVVEARVIADDEAPRAVARHRLGELRHERGDDVVLAAALAIEQPDVLVVGRDQLDAQVALCTCA